MTIAGRLLIDRTTQIQFSVKKHNNNNNSSSSSSSNSSSNSSSSSSSSSTSSSSSSNSNSNSTSSSSSSSIYLFHDAFNNSINSYNIGVRYSVIREYPSGSLTRIIHCAPIHIQYRIYSYTNNYSKHNSWLSYIIYFHRSIFIIDRSSLWIDVLISQFTKRVNIAYKMVIFNQYFISQIQNYV